jgi:hypothetical protein
MRARICLSEAPEVKTDLCPYGNVNDDKPKWNANNAKANSNYAAVCLMRRDSSPQ